MAQHACSRTMRPVRAEGSGSVRKSDTLPGARGARTVEVEQRWDMAKITATLAESYWQEVARKRGG